MYTTRSTIISTFLAATALPACTEWDIEVTTMGGDTALTTIVTAGMSDDEGGESTGVDANTDAASEVTTDPTTGSSAAETFGGETTSSIDDTGTSTGANTDETTGDGRCECGSGSVIPGFCEAIDVMCHTMGLDGTLSIPPGEDHCETIQHACQANGNTCETCDDIEQACQNNLDAVCSWVTTACENIRCEPPIAPLQDPPLGCAKIVEVALHGPMSERHIMIDATGCAAKTVLSATLDLHDSSEPMEFEFPPAKGCITYGGPNSAATSDPGGVIVPVLTPDLPPDLPISEYTIRLLTNGTLSDDLQVPALLIGQQWYMAPLLSTPVRRHADFSWRVAPAHLAGCDL